MSLYTFVRILLRNWWLVAIATVLTAASTAVFVLIQKPIYQASTTIELKPSIELEDPNQILNTINALTRRNVINTIARKATSASMHEQVAEVMSIPVEWVRATQIQTVTPPETNLIEVRAQSTDPAFAAAVANTVVQKMLGQDYEQVISMEVIDPAVPPGAPISPQPVRLITLGIIFGLALGVGFAMLEHLLQSLRNSPLQLGAEIFDKRRLAPAESVAKGDD
jgi:uncharacterized protein involved in exopolysaccharide biosynthesis